MTFSSPVTLPCVVGYALFGLAAGAVCGGAGERFFAQNGFPTAQADLYSCVLSVYIFALIFSSVVWAAGAGRGWRARVRIGGALWCGVTGGILAVAPMALFWQVIAAQIVVVSFGGLLLGGGMLAQACVRDRAEHAGAATIFLAVVFFFTSPYYAGSWVDSSGGGAWGARLAVWSAAPAMIGTAFREFSFPFLPDIYRVWLGPVCPLPGSWLEAAFYYLIPGSVLIALSVLAGRIGRRCERCGCNLH